MPTVSSEELKQLAESILRAAGANEWETQVVSSHLLDANLAGHDSHGVMRVLQYVAEVEAGHIAPGSELQTLGDWPTGAVLDARGMFGQVACHDAMQQAIDKSRTAGIAAVTIRGANHSGRLGAYAEMAAAAGVTGIVMANGGGAGQWVAPFGGREPRLSTNPIAIGTPSSGRFPFLMDISTSVAPEGKVRHCLQNAEPVPEGWLVDNQGNPTTDPRELYAEPGGALLPFGGSSGHKGYGLGFMVDVFAGALTAAGCPTTPRTDPGVRSGLFMLAIDIERYTPLDDFSQRVSDMAGYFKSSEPAAGFDEVLVPGELEYQQRLKRQQEGIPIPDSVWNDLDQLLTRLSPSHHQETSK